MARYSLVKQREFWERAEDLSETTVTRGRAVEGLLVYLVGKVPGVTVIGTNTLAAFESEEIDVAVSNSQSRDGFPFLPRFFLIECKNYTHKVGSPQVAWFDWKIKSRGMSFGLLIATAGVTGSPLERTSANDIIAGALFEKRQLVVLTKDDLVELPETSDFVRLVNTRLGELMLNRAPF